MQREAETRSKKRCFDFLGIFHCPTWVFDARRGNIAFALQFLSSLLTATQLG